MLSSNISCGILPKEDVKFFGLIIIKANLAFMAGSSKQGKARLASVGSKSVDAILKMFFEFKFKIFEQKFKEKTY
jgi:hypothetical protein